MANLSLKGICSLSHQLIDKDGKVNIHNIEMNQDDFEDCVMLTVEEAKELMKLLDLCEYWLTNNNVSYDCDAWASLLEGRIEQVEKQ